MNKLQTLTCYLMATSLLGCSPSAMNQLPANAKLLAKYRVLDERMSLGVVKCDEKRDEFLQASRYACSFKLQGLEFVIERKYVVDSTGHLTEYWPYHAEGPEVRTRQELARDTSLARSEGVTHFHIAFAGPKSLVDGPDTAVITRIFPAEHLLCTARSAQDSLNGRRLIYQYQ
jgi:hypothetical protein